MTNLKLSNSDSAYSVICWIELFLMRVELIEFLTDQGQFELILIFPISALFNASGI